MIKKEMIIEHGPITTERIIKNVWVAKCTGKKPFNYEITMQGVSEQDAISKLKEFLEEAKS